MPHQPYSTNDLRVEAAHCREAISRPPTVDEIKRSLRGTYIDSHRTKEGEGGATWGDLLDEAGVTVVSRRIDNLITGAADVSAWAVNLGADGLEPIHGSLNIQDKAGDDRVRLHFAFAPDMDQATRKAVIDQVADVIRHYS
jgi:hypothetical protein